MKFSECWDKHNRDPFHTKHYIKKFMFSWQEVKLSRNAFFTANFGKKCRFSRRHAQSCNKESIKLTTYNECVLFWLSLDTKTLQICHKFLLA